MRELQMQVIPVQSQPKDPLLEAVMQIVQLQVQRGDLELECDCPTCLFEYVWDIYEKVSPFKKALAA